MLKVYYRIIISCWKTFGISHWFFLWVFLPPLAFILVRLTLALDEILFSKYRDIKVVKPIFIIGHPRSGTTFLHHVLTQTEEFSTFKAWHIFVPSLTARILVKPLVDYLVKHNLNSLIPDDIGHGIYLDKVEEEELLFLHEADTQFVLLTTPLAFDDQEHPELRFHDQQPASRRRSSVKFFESCLKRHIYYTGKKQVIAQIHFSTHRIKTLLEIFPDAKFIYLVRSPHETIPSHLSLDRNFIDNQWGIKNIPLDKIKRYEQRRYRYNVDLYRYFYKLKKNQEIPEANVRILHYYLLISDLDKALEEIVDFTGINPSEQLKYSIKEQAQQQKNYKRKHRVRNLEEFNLTREQIMKDLSFVYQEYKFDQITNKL
ncbi:MULTISPECIES: sulfotransferase [unclassified Moorena]|uniref:sulfotransferase family protein n=1 Tax=unclassified Moorena TaxID=2683338 RepID=UPI0013CB54AA|nr:MULTISPECIES: sulfotransferase [unclassified Moorena]NEO18217.1 sulfotransferase [Moorena sp. SIO4A5]NEQ57311.1 sulfotransferase [Moorena sp. SIO4A1]